MTFSAAGTLASNVAAGLTTLAHTNNAAGNCLVLGTKITSSTITVSSVSGGGATGWVRITGPLTDNQSVIRTEELWLGTVSSTGAQTITVTFSSSNAGINTDLCCQEFSSSLGGSAVWSKDVSGTLLNSASTTVTYPTLVPASGTRLYAGICRIISGAGWSGLTSGFTGQTDTNGNRFIYGLSVTASVSPSETNTTNAASATLGALLTDVAAGTAAHAGLATGTGTAQQPSAAITVRASQAGGIGIASGSPHSAAPPPGFTSQPGLAVPGLFMPGSTGLPAGLSVAVTVPAGLASAAGAALQPAAAIAANAGLAHGTGTALSPAAAIAANAGLAAATGSAQQPGPAAGVNAGLATAAGAALSPAVSTSGSTNAPAGLATGTGTALAPSVAAGANAGLATGTGTALSPAVALTARAGLPAGTGAALNASVTVFVPGAMVKGYSTATLVTRPMAGTAGVSKVNGSSAAVTRPSASKAAVTRPSASTAAVSEASGSSASVS